MSEYEGTLAAVRHCLRIRNQYAHCHWAHDETGIFFANLEEAANRADGFNYDWKQVDLTILNEQEAFFDNMKDRLIYLGDTLANALQKTSPRVPRPPERPLPSLHNPASQHVPRWLDEARQRRHIERAREAEGRAAPHSRPPSDLRLTREEWAAKDEKDARLAAEAKKD